MLKKIKQILFINWRYFVAGILLRKIPTYHPEKDVNIFSISDDITADHVIKGPWATKRDRDYEKMNAFDKEVSELLLKYNAIIETTFDPTRMQLRMSVKFFEIDSFFNLIYLQCPIDLAKENAISISPKGNK